MDCIDQARDHEEFVDSVALLDLLLKVSQLVRIQLNNWLDQFELNDGRFGVLTALSHARDSGLSQAELADLLGQSASNVSTLIERMARDGLVTRIQSGTDRRKRMWSISFQGETRLKSVDARRSAWAARLFKVIGKPEQQDLIDLLQKIHDSSEVSFTTPTKIAPPLTAVTNVTVSGESDRQLDPASDPQSPQFALQQMLLALSSSADVESGHESEAA